MTIGAFGGMISRKVNSGFSARAAVGAAGTIGNRVKIPNGTATVSAEAPYMAKAGHWNILRRPYGADEAQVRISAETRRNCRTLQVRSTGCFYAGKSAAAMYLHCRGLSFSVRRRSPSPPFARRNCPPADAPGSCGSRGFLRPGVVPSPVCDAPLRASCFLPWYVIA